MILLNSFSHLCISEQKISASKVNWKGLLKNISFKLMKNRIKINCHYLASFGQTWKIKTTFISLTWKVWWIKVVLVFWKALSERRYSRFVRFFGQKSDKIQISPLKKDLERIQDHFYLSNFQSWRNKSGVIFLISWLVFKLQPFSQFFGGFLNSHKSVKMRQIKNC